MSLTFGLLLDRSGQILALPAMSERYDDEYSEDEPVIGATYAPPVPPPLAQPVYIGATYTDGHAGTNGYAETYDDDEYFDEEPEDDYDYYEEDDYDEGAPARQPMFYVFIALAALVGGIVVFLLFSLVHNSDSNGGLLLIATAPGARAGARGRATGAS